MDCHAENSGVIQKEDVSFRLMTLEDIEQILVVEKASFATPWSFEAFYNELTKNRFAHYIVVENNKGIIGYCGVWVIIDEGHITNIALLPEYRGNGIGTLLLKQVMKHTRSLGAKTLTLEVRVSNKVAQHLYRKLGFVDGGLRKNYYEDNQEDGLIMWVRL